MMTVQERAAYAGLCSKKAAEARRKGIPYIKPPRPDKLREQLRQSNDEYNSRELSKAYVMLEHAIVRLDHVRAFLEASGQDEPEAAAHAENVFEIMDKIADIQTIMLGLK